MTNPAGYRLRNNGRNGNTVKRKTQGQSLAEFALMLPLLLFMFMAIIDFSRLLLSYTQTSASVRNALRYGVILGLDENNQNYLNCSGIQDAAAAAFFTNVDNVTVKYERPRLDAYGNPLPDIACDSSLTDSDLESGDILVVEVDSTFDFITPFVPFNAVPIDISGQRTLVKEVMVDRVASASSSDNVPLVAIISPDPYPYNLWTDVEGNAITFIAFATDTEDGDLTSAIQWFVDDVNTGVIGATYTTNSLSVGTHYIKTRVTDSDGNRRSNSLQVDIIAAGGNTKPELTVDSPTSAAPYTLSALVNFTAAATDAEDGDLSGAIVWYIDGAEITPPGDPWDFSLVAGTAPLTAGSHDIRAVVEDSGGLRNYAFFTIIIEDIDNAIPNVIIDSPAATSDVSITDTIAFAGTAEDPDGNAGSPLDMTGSLVWRDTGGAIVGIGGSFSVAASSLGPGSHTIKASVTDAQGAAGSASVTVNVTANYNIFLATMYLFVQNQNYGSYTVRMVNGSWDEMTVNWFNLPSTSPTSHSFSTNSRNLGHYVPFEITALVNNWYTDSATYPNYGLLIDATSNYDELDIGSKEYIGGTEAPYIQVYLTDGANNYFCNPIYATADTYVDQSAPFMNRGSATTLRVVQKWRASQDILLRFDTLSTDINNCH